MWLIKQGLLLSVIDAVLTPPGIVGGIVAQVAGLAQGGQVGAVVVAFVVVEVGHRQYHAYRPPLSAIQATAHAAEVYAGGVAEDRLHRVVVAAAIVGQYNEGAFVYAGIHAAQDGAAVAHLAALAPLALGLSYVLADLRPVGRVFVGVFHGKISV